MRNDTSRLERHFDTDLFVTSTVTRRLILNRSRRWSLEEVLSKYSARHIIDRNSTLPVTFSTTLHVVFVTFGMKAIVDQSVSSGCQSESFVISSFSHHCSDLSTSRCRIFRCIHRIGRIGKQFDSSLSPRVVLLASFRSP